MNSPRALLTAAAVFLIGSAFFAALNGAKVQTLQANARTALAERAAAERQRASLEQAHRQTAVEQTQKTSEGDNRIESAEADLVRMQTEKSDLLAKIQANEAQISDLQKKLEETTKSPPTPNPGAPSVTELQAQLDDARKQLDSAEQEKVLVREKAAPARDARPALAIKRSEPAPAFHGSIRGTVLAVNSDYNFVVLNLGNRQGVVANAEMMVLRGGAMIGKIRISSVEPATAIGDIVSNSLARGVRLQPGDIVVYAGSNS